MKDVNLVGRHDETSVDLEGSAEALRTVSRAIRDPVGRQTIPLEIRSAPPDPYPDYIRSVTIERAEGLVRISRAGDRLTVAGAPELLAVLAQNIEFLANSSDSEGSSSGRHVHIEYYEGHFFLHKESVRLIVTKI